MQRGESLRWLGLASFFLFCPRSLLGYCTPPVGLVCGNLCDFGIVNVRIATIDWWSQPIEQYSNFSGTSATVYAGGRYTLRVVLGGTQKYNVKAWIDFDGNGSFGISEVIVDTTDVRDSVKKEVFIPGGAFRGTVRLRVIASYVFFALGGACDTVHYGEIEDYSLTIQSWTQPPVADFGAQPTYTCYGTVEFTDLSQGLPTSWLWDFGDGTTSTQQHPQHTYTSSGTYTVKLKVCNSYGCDSITKLNYITVDLQGALLPPLCRPQTQNYCCGYGIYRVTLGTMNHSSANASEGYQDFACIARASVMQGGRYQVQVNTGGITQEVYVWIDFNGDGDFYDSGELIGHSSSAISPTFSFYVPATGITGQYVRMRVMADLPGVVSSPCTTPFYGQAEDYSVYIEPVSLPPQADFFSPDTSTCYPTVRFYDRSLFLPTSWLWDLGDGSTSTAQNPTHNYQQPGTYTITLTVSNQYGSNQLTKPGYITVRSVSGGPEAAGCMPWYLTSDAANNATGIQKVEIIGLFSYSHSADGGFVDRACEQKVRLLPGGTYNIRVETMDEELVIAWIDFNDDGIFSANEIILNSVSSSTTIHSGTFTVPTTAVQNRWLRLRVASDWAAAPTSCNTYFGEIEDYGVLVVGNPVAKFSATLVDTCADIIEITDMGSSGVMYLWWLPDTFFITAPQSILTYQVPSSYTDSLFILKVGVSNTVDTAFWTDTLYRLGANAAFTPLPNDTALPGSPLTFMNNSCCHIYRFRWDFGDSSVDTTTWQPQHLYTQEGTYEVKLYVENSRCSDTTSHQITITTNPTTSLPSPSQPHTLLIINTDCQLWIPPGKGELTLLTIDGVSIHKETITCAGTCQVRLPAESLPSGTFVVRWVGKEKQLLAKMLVVDGNIRFCSYKQ